jgi:hypothetical protein
VIAFFALAISSPSATPERDDRTEVLVATTREPVLLVVLTSAGFEAGPASAEVLSAADAVFAAIAHVRVETPERAGVSPSDFDACPIDERSSCWAELGRRSRARALVILTLRPDLDGVNATLVGFDLEATGRLLDQGGTKDDIEQAIWDRAIRSEPEPIGSDVRGYFEGTARRVFGGLLRAIAPKESFGRVTIVGLARGAEIELDERSLGVATSTTVHITGVPIGSRRIRVGGATVLDAEIAPETEVRFDVAVPIEPPPYRPIAIGIAVGGVAAGAVLVALGAATRGEVVCVRRLEATGCMDPPRLEPGPGGVEVAAGTRRASAAFTAGAGLLAFGVAWSIGAAFVDEDWIWWIAGASAILGAASAATVYFATP